MPLGKGEVEGKEVTYTGKDQPVQKSTDTNGLI